MLIAQLHTNPGQQFGGFPGRRHHIISSEIQCPRTYRAAALSEKNYARIGRGPQALDFCQRAATQDIGKVGGKQKHIDGAGLDDVESFLLRGSGRNLVPCGTQNLLQLLAESVVRLDNQYIGAFSRQVPWFPWRQSLSAGVVPLTPCMFRRLQGIYIVTGNSGECLDLAWYFGKTRKELQKPKNPENSVFPQHADDAPLNFDVVGSHHNRRHVRIRRLQADLPSSFAVEPLQCGFFSTDQRYDNIARVGYLRLFANHVITVHDVVFNHRTAFYLKHERVAATGKIAKRYRLAFFDGFQRTARRNAANQRQLLNFSIANLFLHGLGQLQNLDRTALIVAATNEAFFLERGDVLVHSRQRRQLQALADLFKAGGVAVLVVKRNQVVQDFFLPLSQRHR